MGALPEHTGHWLMGSLRERREDPLRLFMKVARLGDVSKFRVAWIPVYSVQGVEEIKHVLIDNVQNYWKGNFAKPLGNVIGQGLLLAEGEAWKEHRRLMQPAFHKDVLAALVQGMAANTAAMLDRWESFSQRGKPFDVAAEMMGLTMSIVGQALFGADVTAHRDLVRESLTVLLEETNERILSLNPLRARLPTPTQRRYRAAIAALDALVFEVIEKRRRAGELGQDLLGLLMGARDAETGASLSDVQLRDEVMTLFLAGHETTANGLSWLFYLLGQNPTVASRLNDELHSVLAGRAPTMNDMPRLELTQRCFDEALRLYPPAWLIGRENYAPDVLGGHPIPKGSIVAICPYAIHRLPQYWENPDAFDPDRFMPEASARRPRLAYMPFGAGQRQCIGNSFARVESVVILAMILQRYGMDLVPGHPIETWAQVTLRPRYGVKVTLRSPTRKGPVGRAA